MEVQWLMFAKEFEIKEDTLIDIRDIYHQITDVLPDKPITLVNLVARIKPDIDDIGTDKRIRIDMSHIQHGLVNKYDYEYHVRDLRTWVNNIQYIVLTMRNIIVPYSGEYVFSLYVDDVFKIDESLFASIGG